MFTAATFTFIAMSAYAALCDLEARRVKNSVTLTLLVTGLLVQVVAAGPSGLLAGLAGAALGLAILIWPFSRRWLGAADVKYLAAAGAWLGPKGVCIAALFGLAFGGVWAVVLMVSRSSLRQEVLGNLRVLAASGLDPRVGRRSARDTIPLVVPLAFAAALVKLASGLIP